MASIIPLLKNQYEAELTALKKPTGRQGRRSNQKTKRIAELSRKLAALDKGRLPQQETKMLKEARDKKARDAVAARVNTIARHSGHHAEMAVPRGRGKAIDERVAEYLEENEDEKHEERHSTVSFWRETAGGSWARATRNVCSGSSVIQKSSRILCCRRRYRRIPRLSCGRSPGIRSLRVWRRLLTSKL